MSSDTPASPSREPTRDEFEGCEYVVAEPDKACIANCRCGAKQPYGVNWCPVHPVSPADPTREEAPEWPPKPTPSQDCPACESDGGPCVLCGIPAPSASPVSSPLPRSGTAPGVCPQCRNALGRTPEGDAALCITDDCEAFLCVILPPAAVSREDGGDEDERLARAFHEAYERLAPLFGYETRPESAVPWEQVPENNRRLMIAVAGEVVARLSSQSEEIARLRWERDEARRQAAFAERANAANHQAWKDAEELLQEARAVSNRFVMRAAAESQLARLRAWVDRFPEPSATEIRLTPVTNEGALRLATSFIARIGDWRREGVALFAPPSPGDPT